MNFADDTSEETSSPPCYVCGSPSVCMCRVCNEKYFCDIHGDAAEERCDKCGENYNF